MTRLRVGVIYGGRSGEHEVSLASAAAVFENLDRERYEPVAIRIEKDGRWLLPPKPPVLTSAAEAIQASRGMPAAIVNDLTIAQMSLAIGRGSVVHAALIPGGLSDRFLEEAERLGRYRLSTIEAAPEAADDFSELSS